MCLLLLVYLAVFANVAVSQTHYGNMPVEDGLGYNPGSPWPMPSSYKSYPERYQLNPYNFQFSSNQPSCNIIEDAFKRYYKYVFYALSPEATLKFRPVKFGQYENDVLQKKYIDSAALSMMSVSITSACVNGEYPTLETDESYSLAIDGTAGGKISANTAWGALRALETFSQLVYYDQGMYYVNYTQITDKPRFNHRGLLLDTSRHFIPVSILKQNLDAMAMNKMNVFHWHIVDDPSFPYESKVFPELSQKGAFNPNTHVYTQEDIQELLEYARDRGIRIIPEFDTPGHSQSWGKGVTDLLTKCYSSGKPNGNYGPIDPTVNSTFTFLKTFLTELFQVFPDKYVHLGGDEVSFDCWKSSPVINAFMQKLGFGTDYSKLEGYYIQQLLNIISSLSKDKGYIVWQEVVDNGVKVKPDTVIHVWKAGWQNEMAKVTQAGFKSMLSSCWYLNYINYGNDWGRYYSCEPYNFNGTDEQKKLVMGGEACMWGEYVDGTNVISRTWPRASAVAERLWSPQTVKDSSKATPRLKEQRCRMLRRGLNAEPINGPSFCEIEVQT